jgi:hypothetical protein
MSKTTKSVTKQELLDVTLPEQTETYTVISHEFAMQTVEQGLANAGFQILSESYRANHDGTVARGSYHIEQGDDPEMQMMFAWVNSYDKSTKFQCGVGASLKTNGSYMLTKDMTNFIRKHTGSALEEVETIISEQISKADAFFVELIRDKQAMSNITLEPQQYGELLGRLYVNAKIISTQQISAIKQEFETPSYNYSTPELSLWTLYNHILAIVKSAHPKNFFKQLTVIHAIIQTEFDLLNFDFDFDEEPVEETSGEELEQEINDTAAGGTPLTNLGEEVTDVTAEMMEEAKPALDKTVEVEMVTGTPVETEPIYVGIEDVKEWNPTIEGEPTEGMTIALGTNQYIIDELITDDTGTLCKLSPLGEKEVLKPAAVLDPDPGIQTSEEKVDDIIQDIKEDLKTKSTSEILNVVPPATEATGEQGNLFDTIADATNPSVTEEVVTEAGIENLAVEQPNLDFNLDPENELKEMNAAESETAPDLAPAANEEAYVEDPEITKVLARELEDLLGEPQEFTYTLENDQFMITLADKSMIELDAEYVAMLQEV